MQPGQVALLCLVLKQELHQPPEAQCLSGKKFDGEDLWHSLAMFHSTIHLMPNQLGCRMRWQHHGGVIEGTEDLMS